MRNITIVGAGQSGLQLGLGLLQNGYRVRMITNRTPEDIATGKVMSSQFMFNDSLQTERVRVRALLLPEIDAEVALGLQRVVEHELARHHLSGGDVFGRPVGDHPDPIAVLQQA